jgi:S1-C subfamily serine protease
MKWVVGSIAVIVALVIGIAVGWTMRARAENRYVYAPPPPSTVAPPVALPLPSIETAPPSASEVAWPLTAADDVVVVDPSHYLVRRSFATTAMASSVRVVPEVVDGSMRGVRIFGVRADGPPAKLGFENGDTVETINGEQPGPLDVLEAFPKAKVGTKLAFGIVRRGTHLDLHYKIAP